MPDISDRFFKTGAFDRPKRDAASAMSDDECLMRLAQAVEEHDSAHLDEVARLIARLAVTIE